MSQKLTMSNLTKKQSTPFDLGILLVMSCKARSFDLGSLNFVFGLCNQKCPILNNVCVMYKARPFDLGS